MSAPSLEQALNNVFYRIPSPIATVYYAVLLVLSSIIWSGHVSVALGCQAHQVVNLVVSLITYEFEKGAGTKRIERPARETGIWHCTVAGSMTRGSATRTNAEQVMKNRGQSGNGCWGRMVERGKREKLNNMIDQDRRRSSPTAAYEG